MFNLNLTEVLAAETSQKFDEIFTKKIHGVERIEDFLNRISSVHVIKNIQIPFLSI
jgi:predicted alpha/beta-fold hydrolase